MVEIPYHEISAGNALRGRALPGQEKNNVGPMNNTMPEEPCVS